MRLFSPPKILRFFYPDMLWQMPSGEKKIYLTFDDGPHPRITPKVLDILDSFNAKATFFCIGHNVERYPDVFEEIKKRGHLVGNHTYDHNDGFSLKDNDFYDEIRKTDELVKSPFFRPPHGRISFRQISHLKKNFTIVAWTVIAYDWDKKLSPKRCFDKVVQNTGDGSIVAFHDSEKAEANMFDVLPRVLQYFSDKGFTFSALK